MLSEYRDWHPYQSLQSGTIIDERFVIRRFLGSGGLSRVYLATDQMTGNEVALKVPDPAPANMHLSYPMQCALLQHEAHILLQLCHPGIVHLCAARLHHAPIYLALGYAAGTSLHLFTAHVRLPVSTVLRLGDKIAAIIAYLHAQHPPVLHLDIKPANIILQPDGSIMLLDFGTARFVTLQQSDLPLLGTPPYAPPEQQARLRLDQRADIYALGQVMWELIGEQHVPTVLARVLDRSTAPLSQQRYSSVTAFREALFGAKQALHIDNTHS